MDSGSMISEGFRIDRKYIGAKSLESEIFVHRLKVEEAMAADAGRNVARIDASSLILLGINPGNAIILIGPNGRKLAASCQESLFLEMDSVIRIDKIMRYNLGLELGELLGADAILEVISDPPTCSEMTLEPISLAVPAAIDARYIGRALDGMTVVQGQVIAIPYFGGRWFPYSVSSASVESPTAASAAKIGSETDIRIEWQHGN